MTINRRAFLQTTAAAATALGMTAKSYARVIGANNQLRLGVMGLNGRGKDHLAALRDRVVALCDCDRTILDAQVAATGLQGFVDYRELLNQPDVDGVMIATPNHSHSLIAIQALLAGKHVYVEKPVSHNVWEGRQLVEHTRQTGLICQAGTQSRSSPALQQAREFLIAGNLGKPQYAIGTCFKPRRSIGRTDTPLAIPESVDYDLWCAGADKVPLFRPRFHYDWHWDFNTGNGDMGNQGIHQMDIARWFLGHDHLSPRVLSVGGRLGYSDAGDTPNTQTVLHDYPEAPIIFETRGLPRDASFHADAREWDRNMDSYRGSRVGVLIQCEGGHLLIPNYTSVTAYDNQGQQVEKWSGDGHHFANFADAIEQGDPSKLVAPVREGHLSSGLCHTGNISHQVGRLASLAEIRQAVASHPWFAESVERMVTHLQANGIDVASAPRLTLGADLKMDTSREQFHDHPRANGLLQRRGRAGFEIPVAEDHATGAAQRN